jgi:PEP-CTERM/exosortase A-associated glycosyltransferase
MAINNSHLKILHILDHSLPLHSGYTFRSQNIFLSQKKRGWQPVILTSPKHEESWKGHWEKEEEIGGFCYYRSGRLLNCTFPLEAELRLMAKLARRIREVVEREKPDMLHVHSPILNAIPALWIARKLGIPIVYEVRAFWEDAAVDHESYRQNSWKYKLAKSIETWICQKTDQVIVICHGLKKDLKNRGIPSEKLTVVPNGISVNDFKACEPDAEYMETWKLVGKKVIGFIGSFYRYEGLDLLVDAIAHLSTTRSDITLLMIGGGEMETELKAKIKRLHLEEKVIMPGRIPHDRIPSIYALVDIMAYPRYFMRLTELVTPLKPLEAMAMGKALVASDIGGHRELIKHGHTGLLFQAGNVYELAKALGHLLDNHNLCQELGTQGAAWVYKERSWDKTTAVYYEIYQKAMKKFSLGLKEESREKRLYN